MPALLPVLSLLSLPGLMGCGFSDLLPTTAVLTAEERAWFDVEEPSGARYTGGPRVAYPVLPMQVWGLRYALDVVIRTTDPEWDMHEYALIQTPRGPLWLAKDADDQRRQHITADVPGLASWAPEVPAPRTSGPVEVIDQGDADEVSLEFRYTDPHGEEVVVRVEGPYPTEPSPKRNGNTMGHSADIAAVLLDLHRFGPARRAEITVGGERQRIERVAGVYPMRLIIAQTQGGLAIADARLSADPEGGLVLTRPGGDQPWNTASVERWYADPGEGGEMHLRHSGDLVTLDYRFRDGELVSASAWQYMVPDPVTEVAIRPALPDLRRPFAGEVVSRFAVDIAGQRGHGAGTIRARWDGEAAVLDILPEAPAWFASRPMQARLRYAGEDVFLTVVRR